MSESTATVAKAVTDRIEREFCTSPGALLPSVRLMAKQYHVSVNTVCAALAELRRRGLVEGSRGRRHRVPGAAPVAATSVHDRCELLYTDIASAIRDGTYPVGRPLPKIHYFAAESGLTRHLVARVLSRLVSDGLAHRVGRGLVVGAPRRLHSEGALPEPPVIGVVLQNAETWQHLWANRRTWRFYDTFAGEAERLGARIQLIAAIERGRRDRLDLIDQLDSALADARTAGPRYRGFLIAGRQTDTFPIERIARALVRVRQPVAWFDEIGGTEQPPFSHPLFLLCRFSERHFAEAAADYLWRCNHRNVLFIGSSDEPWQRERAAMMEERLHAHDPAACVTFTYESANHWRDPVASGFLDRARLVSRKAPVRIRRAFETMAGAAKRIMATVGEHCPGGMRSDPHGPFFALMNAFITDTRLVPADLYTPLRTAGAAVSLCHLLADRTFTVLVAPNDMTASIYHLQWLEFAGLQTPRDISFLSFDNRERGFVKPMTTVDPGFGYLGYQAFHWISRILPVRAGRAHEMLARASIVDRGSVGVV